MIRHVLLMVRKDLKRAMRSPVGILVLLAFPLLFSLLIGAVFGSGDATLPKVRLLVENGDGGIASRLLLGAFGSGRMAEFFDVEEVGPEGADRMEAGEASALLRIPDGFTDDLLAGRPVTLGLVRNPAEQILPEIAEQLARALTEVLSTGSRVLREPLGEISDITGNDDKGMTDEMVAAIAVSFRRTLEQSGNFVFPPVITLDVRDATAPTSETGGDGSPSVFLIVLPGVSVFALFMLGDLMMRGILTEGEEGTLRRQICGPLGTGTVVAAKAVFTGVVASLALLILTAVGWAVSPRPIDIPAFILLSFSLVLAVTGASAVVYGLARTLRQGATIGSIVYLFLAFVGGSFFDVKGLPSILRAAGPFTPFYWATQGYRSLIRDGAGLGAVLPWAGLLAVTGLGMLALGSALLSRRIHRGASA